MNYLSVKRFFDFLSALLLLLLILPLFLLIALILKFTGEGEIFYLQKRIGKDKKPFFIKKFATMLKDSLNIGSKTVTLRNDPRITPAGKFLRKSKLNELPQILNVLNGDMSVVGARPLLPGSFLKYSPAVQDKIYRTRPGITGIGSVVFRDEEKLITQVRKSGMEPLDYYKNHIYPYKGAVEMWYQKNIGFLTDLKIILLTVWVVIFPDSKIVYKAFKDLPTLPPELSPAGIEKLAV